MLGDGQAPLGEPGHKPAPTAGQTNPYALFGCDLNGNMTSRDRRYDGGLRRHYTFFWDGDDRLRTAQESGVTRLQASGPGGVLFDDNAHGAYTPGLWQNQGGEHEAERTGRRQPPGLMSSV